MNLHIANHYNYNDDKKQLEELNNDSNITKRTIVNMADEFFKNELQLMNVKSLDLFLVDSIPCLTVWFNNDTYKNFYNVSYYSTTPEKS